MEKLNKSKIEKILKKTKKEELKDSLDREIRADMKIFPHLGK